MIFFKRLLSTIFIVSFSIYAQANDVSCTSDGDSLHSVELYEHIFDKKTKILSSKIKIVFLNDTEELYVSKMNLNRSLRNIVPAMVGKKADSIDFGGGSSQSILISFSEDLSSGLLSESGYVHVLKCRKLGK